MSSRQNELLKMSASSVCVPRLSSICLLPLWVSASTSNPVSFQTLLILAPWACEIFCVPFKSTVYFLYVSSSSESKPHLTSKIKHHQFLGPWSPVWGACCGAWIHWSLGRNFVIVLFMGHWPIGMDLEYTLFIPLLTISLWSILYIFRYRKHFFFFCWSSDLSHQYLFC